MAKSVFFSFHFDNDYWRTQQVRNMGVIEGNAVATPNEWEEIKRKGVNSIEKWIDDNLKYKKCTIVLIGSETSNRYWVKQEIIKSWNAQKGLLGIYIHNLKDKESKQCKKGKNPFSEIKLKNGLSLDSYVRTYESPYSDSKDTYNYIAENIESWIETAIKDR